MNRLLAVAAVLVLMGFQQKPKEYLVTDIEEMASLMTWKVKWHVQDKNKNGYNIISVSVWCECEDVTSTCYGVIVAEKR